MKSIFFQHIQWEQFFLLPTLQNTCYSCLDTTSLIYFFRFYTPLWKYSINMYYQTFSQKKILPSLCDLRPYSESGQTTQLRGETNASSLNTWNHPVCSLLVRLFVKCSKCTSQTQVPLCQNLDMKTPD